MATTTKATELSQLSSALQVDESTGEIIFTGSLSVDSNTLFIDAANNRIGIGTSNPQVPMQLAYTSGVPDSSLLSSDAFVITAEDTAPGFVFAVASDDSGGHRGVFKAIRSRGTLASPTAANDNDSVFSLLGTVYDGVEDISSAGITMAVDGNVSTGVAPQRIEFLTGSGPSRQERMRIDSSGRVGIGTSSPNDTLDVDSIAPVFGENRGPNENKFWRPRVPTYTAGGGDDWFSPFFISCLGDKNDLRIGGGTNTARSATNIYFHTAEDLSTTSGDVRMRIDSNGIVDILSGSVELNGNRLNGLEVTIADNAVAELTFPGRAGGGFIFIVEDGDDGFPQQRYSYSGFVDFGDSPDIQPEMFSGGNVDTDKNNTLTGTTGTDGNVTIGVAGDSGTLYLENRTGNNRIFQITLL